jgi:23S rRNA pseudouridine1911/1915/1917 synthase
MALKAFLCAHGYSHRLLSSLKNDLGSLLVDGFPARAPDILRAGNEISVLLPKDTPTDALPSDIPAEVLFENENLVVLNKPPGVAVHRTRRYQEDTLENIFAAYLYGENGLTYRPLNRLDRDTSGAVVVAKNQLAAAAMSGGGAKNYLAVAEGEMPPGEYDISAPISRKNSVQTVRMVAEGGRLAHTKYTVLSSRSSHSLLWVTPLTGRTHQIRVHLSNAGHPLAGDDLYGGSLSLIPRQALHCLRLRFTDPVFGQDICVTAPLPRDISELIKYVFGEAVLTQIT